jgi:hypothetical protein
MCPEIKYSEPGQEKISVPGTEMEEVALAAETDSQELFLKGESGKTEEGGVGLGYSSLL